MKILNRNLPIFLAFYCFIVFLFCTRFTYHDRASVSGLSLDRVVMSELVLLILHGGDRFLAADTETIRLAVTGVDYGVADINYLMRSQVVVAKLNPCHEDNYYLANALLAWGGADQEASGVLLAAMNCRFWDATPAFFYGFNRSFFKRDLNEASRALELAAQRAPEKASAYRKLAIMLRVEGFSDERMALDYLIEQRDSARKDAKLFAVLNQRVVRLQGLVVLRDAKLRFESKFGDLTDIQELVRSGFISEIPVDPLGLGYELKGGVIVLRKFDFGGDRF